MKRSPDWGKFWHLPGSYRVSPLTRFPEVTEQMPNLPRKVHIIDETFREGGDTPGFRLTTQDAVEIATKLAEVGVPEIDIGRVPLARSTSAEYAKAIKEAGVDIHIHPMLHEYDLHLKPLEELKKDIDFCMEVGADSIKFCNTAPSQEARIALLPKTRELIDYIHQEHNSEVSVMWPRATATDMTLITYAFKEHVDAGADRVAFCDSSNCAHPTAIKYLVNEIRKVIGHVPLQSHIHNDFGLATANTLAAVEAGCSQVGVTVNGLGDRGGCASLEEVVCALEMMYGVDTGIALDELYDLSQLVEKLGGIPVQYNKAIVGRNASLDTVVLPRAVHLDAELTVTAGKRKGEFVYGVAGSLEPSVIKAGLDKMSLEYTETDVKKIREALEEEMDKEIDAPKRRKNYVTETEFQTIAREIIK